MKHNATINAYDSNAEYHANKFNRIGVRKDYIDTAFSFIGSKPYCLELGCGNGRDAEYILTQTDNYVGIDASKELLKLAKKRLESIDFICADFRKYDFKEESFDLIFAFASLLHLPVEEVTEILDRVHKWLKDDGVFCISLKYGQYSEYKKVDETGARYFYFYTPEDIRVLLGNKFSVIHETRSVILGVDWFETALKKVS